jgi:hypothetical protein
MFPAGFRALGLGKVIGTPTMGAVIGTGSYSLIDGSTIRTPAVVALRFLAQTGEVVLCGSEVVLGTAAFAKMKAQVTTALRARPATTSELRQLLGTSRRVLIPFLEHLDKTGLTLREGDRRRLR